MAFSLAVGQRLGVVADLETVGSVTVGSGAGVVIGDSNSRHRNGHGTRLGSMLHEQGYINLGQNNTSGGGTLTVSNGGSRLMDGRGRHQIAAGSVASQMTVRRRLRLPRVRPRLRHRHHRRGAGTWFV